MALVIGIKHIKGTLQPNPEKGITESRPFDKVTLIVDGADELQNAEYNGCSIEYFGAYASSVSINLLSPAWKGFYPDNNISLDELVGREVDFVNAVTKEKQISRVIVY